MSFRTRYQRVRTFSNAGSPYIDTYKQSVDDNGEVILVKSGHDNVYNQIQAERDSCELKQILNRLSKDEWSKYDISKGGLFGDFTKVPKSIKEMRERMLEAENAFMSLPVELREKFDHSTDKFFSSIGTDYYNTVMGSYFKQPSEDVITNTEGEIKE